MIVNSNQTVKDVNHAVTSDNPHRPCTDARIWNRVANRYALKPVAAPEAYAHKLAMTQKYLHHEAEVLEVGCGTGLTALAHAPFVKHIRATDFSPKMIEIALSNRSAASACNVDFACSSVDDESASGLKFDVVLALNLLHLLAGWENAIEMMRDTLKPGGVFVSSTICLKDGMSLIRPIATLGRSIAVIPQLTFFSRDELESALINAGFDIEYGWQPEKKSAVFLIARKSS